MRVWPSTVLLVSHPSRGAWIEILVVLRPATAAMSRTPHGVRGLKLKLFADKTIGGLSHPSRGAWIEIRMAAGLTVRPSVAPLTGCVD